MFIKDDNCLIYRYDNEIVRVEPWGENALRVRATKNKQFTKHDWALLQEIEQKAQVAIYKDENADGRSYANMYRGGDGSYGEITNGKLKARMNANGVISFYNQKGELLLKEQWKRLKDEPSMALDILGRDYGAQQGENYGITARFCANDREKIFGMGQYQQKYLDMKGCNLELAQRNSQVSVPFYVSNIGYGFLWNNPAIGGVFFGKNGTQWEANSTKQLDYLVIAEDSPAAIEETYMRLTGTPPMMPEYGMGFWQCKLRYRTQEELLSVARKHKELGLPMDVIVVDFFHWTQQGEYKFDPLYWPDVPAMCEELDQLGIKLMVSVWPTVDKRSENFLHMMEQGYLVRTEKGIRVSVTCFGQEVFYDATNPNAREFVWSKIKQNYWDQGVKLFWLDVAEPEYTGYSFDHYRYQLGTNLEVGNIYPKLYTKGFYDGTIAEGNDKPIFLVRSAWAGSAKYGALVWSGDIDSTFECLQRQVRGGLSIAMAGIPWWATDIGGFHGADISDPGFRKLLIRWFEYACFCPVFRLHGNRNPSYGYEGDLISGVGSFGSGADNEVWSYGEEAFTIIKKYLLLREQLRDYIEEQMQQAHKKGTPVMRPLFYDFPEDGNAWEIDDAYMFGPDLLIAPVIEEDAYEREVYLPEGEKWKNAWDQQIYEGGSRIRVTAPLEVIPVFVRYKGDNTLDFMIQ